jgi:Ca2+-binding RTX toxin-like protein
MRQRGSAGLALGLAALLSCAAAPAPATTYHTTPSPKLGADCSQGNPCSLERALHESPLKDGDEVIVGPGTYDKPADGNLFVSYAIDLHGTAGQPKPLILTDYGEFPSGLSVSDAATVSDLEIRHSGGGTGSSGLSISTESGTAVAERLVVKAQGIGCVLGPRALIRDSVCQGVSNTAGADGLLMAGSNPSSKGSATVSNVTAIGASTLGVEEYGIQVFASGGAEQLLLGNNVIAIGGDGDVRVETSSDSSSFAGALFANSNFSTVSSAGPGTEIPAAPGEAGNQTAEPQLVDPLSAPEPFQADLHQLSGSPTVNAGGPGAELGSTDVDGEPRCMGSGLDIGADELTEAPCPSGAGPPDGPTQRVSAPRCKGRAATIVARSGRRTNGTPRRDVIVGTNARDVIRARGGRDLVCGRNGKDLILGGAGPDSLCGEGGRDILRGQGGVDLLLGGAGLDRLLGGAGRDKLRGKGDIRRQ